MGTFVQVNTVYLLFLRIRHYRSQQASERICYIADVSKNILSINISCDHQTAHYIHVPEDISDFGDACQRVGEEEFRQSDDTGQNGNPLAQIPVHSCLN